MGLVEQGELRAEIEAVDATGEHDPAERIGGNEPEMIQHLRSRTSSPAAPA